MKPHRPFAPSFDPLTLAIAALEAAVKTLPPGQQEKANAAGSVALDGVLAEASKHLKRNHPYHHFVRDLADRVVASLGAGGATARKAAEDAAFTAGCIARPES